MMHLTTVLLLPGYCVSYHLFFKRGQKFLNPCDTGPVYTREKVTVSGDASRLYTGILLSYNATIILSTKTMHTTIVRGQDSELLVLITYNRRMYVNSFYDILPLSTHMSCFWSGTKKSNQTRTVDPC